MSLTPGIPDVVTPVATLFDNAIPAGGQTVAASAGSYYRITNKGLNGEVLFLENAIGGKEVARLGGGGFVDYQAGAGVVAIVLVGKGVLARVQSLSVAPGGSGGTGPGAVLTYSVGPLSPGQSATASATNAHTTVQVLAGAGSDAVTITNATKNTNMTISKSQGAQPFAVSPGDALTYAAGGNSGTVSMVGA